MWGENTKQAFVSASKHITSNGTSLRACAKKCDIEGSWQLASGFAMFEQFAVHSSSWCFGARAIEQC